MLNPNRQYGNVEDLLEEALNLTFSKNFAAARFFQIMVQIADDPDLRVPANLLFAIYNVLIK